MPGWMNESKFTHSFIHSFIPGIKIARRSTNDLRYADDTTLMAKSEEESESLDEGEKESEWAGLKFNIKKTKIMTSSPITSWQTDG